MRTPEFGKIESIRGSVFSPHLSALCRNNKIKRSMTDAEEPKRQKIDPNKISILLDLDQTLVDVRDVKTPGSLVVEMSEDETYYVTKRPDVDLFVSKLAEAFNVFIYTASEKKYAYEVLKATGIIKYVKRIYHRKYCVPLVDCHSQKFLSKLGFKPHNTILIDDSVLQVRPQIENSLLVERFEGDPNDIVLQKMLPFLLSIASISDVRPVTSRYFDYCSENNRKKQRPRTTSKLRKALTFPDTSEVSDVENCEGGKAISGQSPSLENPIKGLKQKIARDHVKTFIEKSGYNASLSPMGRNTFMATGNYFSAENDEYDAEVGIEKANLNTLKATIKSTPFSTRMQYNPYPVLCQNYSYEADGDIEIDL
eukprot:CAMPEP_0176435350 /NCGR_PEP_ID=MMETSP0127-20121128/17254_1 /TAXON_ID=938130 /ORGANISM="Platyophrya macrostoma, Strain WH" /LENGTH=366 /DNA_ID=CAMNT_0017818329 /DNA_START=166 /DNA_END=1266 /DNA_ORIENTATION=+